MESEKNKNHFDKRRVGKIIFYIILGAAIISPIVVCLIQGDNSANPSFTGIVSTQTSNNQQSINNQDPLSILGNQNSSLATIFSDLSQNWWKNIWNELSGQDYVETMTINACDLNTNNCYQVPAKILHYKLPPYGLDEPLIESVQFNDGRYITFHTEISTFGVSATDDQKGDAWQFSTTTP